MGKNGSAPSKDASPSSNAVFIDSNLDTHFAMMVSDVDTVSDLKRKMIREHWKCFPNIGQIDVHCLKVKRKGFFYHLSEAMLVRSAFEGMEKNWFLLLEASTAKDEGIPCSNSPTHMISAPNFGTVKPHDSPKNLPKVVHKHKQIDVTENNSVNERLYLQPDSSGTTKIKFFLEGNNSCVAHCTSNGKNATGVHHDSDSSQLMQNYNVQNKVDPLVQKEPDTALKMQNHIGKSRLDPGVHKKSDPARKMQNHNEQNAVDPGVHQESDPARKMQNIDVQNKVDPRVHQESGPARKMQNHKGQNRADPSVQECDPAQKLQKHNGQNAVESLLVSQNNLITANCKAPSLQKDIKTGDSLVTLKDGFSHHDASVLGSSENVLISKQKSHSGRKKKKSKVSDDPSCSPNVNGEVDIQCEVFLGKSQTEHVLRRHKDNEMNSDVMHYASHKENDSSMHDEPVSTCVVKKNEVDDNKTSIFGGQSNAIITPDAVPSSQIDVAIEVPFQDTLKPTDESRGPSALGLSENDHLSEAKSGSKRKRKKSKTRSDPYFSPSIEAYIKGAPLEKVPEHCEGALQEAGQSARTLAVKETHMSDKAGLLGQNDMGQDLTDVVASSKLSNANEAVEGVHALKELKSRAKNKTEVNMFLSAFTKTSDLNISNEDAAKNLHQTEGIRASKDASDVKIGEPSQTKKTTESPKCVIMNDEARKKSEITLESTAKNGGAAETNVQEVGDKPLQSLQIECSLMGGRTRRSSRKRKSMTDGENPKADTKTGKLDISSKTPIESSPGKANQVRSENSNKEILPKAAHTVSNITISQEDAKEAGKEEIHKQDTANPLSQATQTGESFDYRNKSEMHQSSNAKKLQESNIHEHESENMLSQTSHELNDKARKRSRKHGSVAEVGRSKKSNVKAVKVNILSATPAISSPMKANEVETDNFNKEKVSAKTEHAVSKINLAPASVGGVGKGNIVFDDSTSSGRSTSKCSADRSPRNSSTSGYSTDGHSDMDSQRDGSKQKPGSWKQGMKSISGAVASTIDNIFRSSSSYKNAKLAAESQLEDIDSQAEPTLLSTEPINKP